MTSLLASLMNQSDVTETSVEETKAKLTTDTVATLEGVNAPEFEAFDNLGDLKGVDAVIASTEAPQEVSTVADDMDAAFANQDNGQASESFNFNEYFEDVSSTETANDAPTTSETTNDTHTISEPTDLETENETPMFDNLPYGVEPDALPWNLLPLHDRYFGFGGRTVNSLSRVGYTTFNDIKGMSHSELLEIKGFGRNCLTEVLEFLEAEGQDDWLLKRKSRKADVETAEPVVAEPTTEAVVAEPTTEAVVAEPTTEAVVAEPTTTEAVIAEPTTAEAVTAEAVTAEAVTAEAVIAEPTTAEAVTAEAVTAEAGDTKKASETQNRLRVLVIGNAVASFGGRNATIVSFEQVYAPAISQICEQANSPSIAMVEYGKGWSALSATIRNMGWPNGVDVLCVSKSFLSRSEVLMELRMLADVIVEG